MAVGVVVADASPYRRIVPHKGLRPSTRSFLASTVFFISRRPTRVSDFLFQMHARFQLPHRIDGLLSFRRRLLPPIGLSFKPMDVPYSSFACCCVPNRALTISDASEVALKVPLKRKCDSDRVFSFLKVTRTWKRVLLSDRQRRYSRKTVASSHLISYSRKSYRVEKAFRIQILGLAVKVLIAHGK